MWRALLMSAAWVVAAAASGAADAPVTRRYFGEPLPGLSDEELRGFENGARLFARGWDEERSGVANAPSCVACHSVPTPGGSGMTDRALVSIDPSAEPGTRAEVLQRQESHVLNGELRRTPALFGIGFLEVVGPGPAFGPFRLGAHNQQADLTDFVSSAFATELGVSTTRHCARPTVQAPYPATCTAAIGDGDLRDIVFYLRNLAPPPPPSRATAVATAAFERLGCSGCHTPVLELGSPAAGRFAGARIRPFSDLRAHDVGTSRRGPIRTTPLWGLNSFGPPYLHDGSSDSIEAAILAHRGEAEAARAAFESLPGSERAALLDYLRSF